MSIRKSAILFGVAMSMAAFMSGCSSSTKDGGSGADVAKVGDTKCFQCHAATADPLTGETFIEQYQRSLHAELGCESCHGGGAMHNGIGPFPYDLDSGVSDAKKAERCAMCHDGVTQITALNGEVVTAPLSSSPNFSNGNHANPFSAEEAHEAKCARCHSHEGSILYGKAGFTGDASILTTANQPVLARDPETFNTIKCATCHEHGGNIRQTNTLDATGKIVTWDPDANKVVSQFDLCTSCHTMNTNNGMLIGSGNILSIAKTAGGFTNVTTAAFYHNKRWFRTLPSTHYDQPASGTVANVGTIIEGYIIRKNVKNPCFECHGHEFQTNTRRLHPQATAAEKARPNTVFLDWAQSAHAGRILKQKIAAAAATTDNTAAQVDAVMKAGVTDASGVAWSHYNWDDTKNATASSSRGDCQRCHTSTGASNYLSNPATYDYNNNNFAHLSGWKAATSSTNTTSSGQNELLYCWGCHSNAGTGKLRAPGAIQVKYSSASGAGYYFKYSLSFPDVSGSNICVACHSGREAGDSIKAVADTTANSNGANISFINSHYLGAAGMLFGKIGYTYGTNNYANPSFFAHDKIGSAAAPGTGSNGPCVGCHMSSNNKHLFLNTSTSAATGAITALKSKACINCHDDSSGTALAADSAAAATFLEDEASGYAAALKTLEIAIKNKGVDYNGSAYPYFYISGTASAFKDWLSIWPSANWRDSMGAAFNLNLMSRDPGGFAHNRFYSKRLIWDSVDFMTDGTLGNVTSMNAVIDGIVGLPSATATAAKTYLGDTRL